jgi:hypothetical protein
VGRAERKELIAKLEDLRESRVITYVTGDRAPAAAQIGDDAVRPLYDHLRQIGRTKRLDLFIYSRGGAIDVPWRIVSALRRVSDLWGVLIPFRANSAATLIALGADSIVMGPQAELGPIDPIMNIQRLVPRPGGGGGTVVQEQVSVEDVMAYVRFVQERARLADQDALSNSLSKLTERIDAVALGSVYRTHSHIRDVARRILLSRKVQANEQTLAAIVESLAERVYAHGHAIGVKDAQDIGLPVQATDEALDGVMWKLLNEYEQELKLLQPIDPASVIATNDVYSEDATIAMIESAMAVDAFIGRIEVRAKRQMPLNFNLTLNINLQLPPGIEVQQLPAQLQQMMQQAQQTLLQQAQEAVKQALQQQAPLLGIEAAFRDGIWRRSP